MKYILYRAKSEEEANNIKIGDMIYGYYVKTDGNHKIYLQDYDGADFCYVDPGTIGQYTGLKDKNGKQIFEGDILSAYLDEIAPENETRLVVEWDYERAAYYGANLGFRGYKDFFVGGFEKNFEVIGNIYDNPELLEVE